MSKIRAKDFIHLRQLVADRKRTRDRKARVMRPPDPAVIAYTRDILRVMDSWQKVVLDRLKPELYVFDGSTSGATSAPIRFDVMPTNVDQALQELRNIIDDFIKREGVSSMMDQNVGRVNSWTIQELSNSLGIDVAVGGLGLAPLMEQFRTENVLKIRSYLAGSLTDMGDILDNSFGLRVEDISTNIEDSFGVTRQRATLLARDQTLKLNSAITMQRQNEVGVTHYIWVTSHDERVRGNPSGKWPVPKGGGGDHFSLDGRTFSWLEPPITNTKTQARNHPGQDYQCRCTATPVLTGILD